MSNNVKYFVFNDTEEIEVLPHTAGEGVFSFANANLAGTDGWANPEVLYTFDNGDKDGAFVNNDVVQLDVTGVWDIRKEEVSSEDQAV